MSSGEPVATTAAVSEGLPLEKTNAPEIGWPSAETTRQATV